MLAMSVDGPLAGPPGSSRPSADHPVDQSEGAGSGWTGTGGLEFPIGLGFGFAGRRLGLGGVGVCVIGTAGGAFLRVLVVGGSGEYLRVWRLADLGLRTRSEGGGSFFCFGILDLVPVEGPGVPPVPKGRGRPGGGGGGAAAAAGGGAAASLRPGILHK